MTMHHPLSRPFNRMLLATALTLSPWAASGQTIFYSDITSANWASQVWTPPPGVPGTTDGTPSTDSVRVDKTTSGAGELRLVDNRNVANFTRFRALDSVGGSIRLVNNINSDIKLTVGDQLSVETGYLTLRAHHNYVTRRFTVETDRLLIGSTEWGGAVPGAGINGSFYISGLVGSNDYSRVTLQVNTTTTIVGNGRLSYEGTPTGEARIDLGDLIFQDNVHNGTPMTATISLESAPSPEIDHRVRLRSLRSEAANSSNITITGGATLELYGNAPAEPQDHRFYGEVMQTTRLEKTGSNTQALSRSEGNSYSGGTLISAGTLVVENNTGSGLGSGSVTVEGSGALGGSGRIELAAQETITVKTGATLAPGKDGETFNTLRIASPAGSTVPTLSMEAGSRFTFTIGASNASDAIEFLNYAPGALALASGGIEIAINGPLTAGVYQLLVFREGGEGSALVSSGFDSGLYVQNPSADFNVTLHYNDAAFGGPGVIAMEVTAVPEPSTIAFFVAGVGFLGLRMARGIGKAF